MAAKQSKAGKRRLAVLISLLCLGLLGLVLISQQRKLNTIYAEQETLATELETLQNEAQRIEYMIEYAHSEEYRLQYAREKLGYVGPDDMQFDITD